MKIISEVKVDENGNVLSVKSKPLLFDVELKEIIKPMGTFKPIAMKCTQEQFEAIKPKLEIFNISGIEQRFDTEYLTNWFGNEKQIDFTWVENKRDYNREVHEEWNEEIFLKACGIEVESHEEKLRKEARERGFVNGVMFYGSEGSDSDKPILINDNIKYTKPIEDLNTSGLYVNNSWLCINGKWGTLVEETLEQQLQKAEAEVKRLREAIEDNKIKDGDWCVFWNHDKSKSIIAKFQGNRFACITSGDYFLNCEKITDSVLLENLNKMF